MTLIMCPSITYKSIGYWFNLHLKETIQYLTFIPQVQGGFSPSIKSGKQCHSVRMSPHLQVKYYLCIYMHVISCVIYIHIYLYIFKYMYIASTLCAKVAKIKSRDKLYVHV